MHTLLHAGPVCTQVCTSAGTVLHVCQLVCTVQERQGMLHWVLARAKELSRTKLAWSWLADGEHLVCAIGQAHSCWSATKASHGVAGTVAAGPNECSHARCVKHSAVATGRDPLAHCGTIQAALMH